MNIKNKVVVITGAASGIGRALAIRMLQEKPTTLVLSDVDDGALTVLANEIGAKAIACDVGDELEVQNLVKTVEEDHGHIDLFCGNAGILSLGGVETSNQTFQKVWDINVMSHIYAARAALPGMLERGEGYFLITASAAGLLTQLGSLSYSMSKHAALSCAECVADMVIDAIEEENFLVLPHPEAKEYFKNKATDYDRWINGMQRLQQQFSELMPKAE